MRSLVVTAWFPDRDVPSRTPFVLEHCWSLQEAGHEVAAVHVVIGRTRRESVREVYQGVPVTRVWLDVTDPLSYVLVARTISQGLRGADVLHTMAFSAVLLAGPSWVLRRRPWVHTEHWNGVVAPASVGPHWERLAWSRHALRLPHAVTGVTRELADEMARFARPRATHVVPCVVDHPRPVLPFPPAPPLRLVGVGAFIERKQPLLALEVVARLVERGTDVRYTMVGTGPLLERARHRARELGIADRVVFTGAVAPSRVVEEMSCAHVFFLPSAQENFFTAVAESLAAGRPAAVPLSGGFDDYCNDENSVLTDSWDPDVLADAVLRAWDRFRDTDPARIADTVRERFSRGAVGALFSELYGQLVRR
ncbi:glycosyltransferase [Kocuria sp. SM24M-10]|uniref:glycosyltransferase n=1 Tax=Kocuria sp. SM24M-10 TaxID=1660349 RepID=UPI0006495D63|nr:glycosyltransferase [Kocuria sp. SM24M-10]KLU10122.1 glycosyltransferase [Kocuria sp. SM24M-10]